MKHLLTLAFGLLFFVSTYTADAQKAPTLELFHGRDCPHCHAELDWLPELEALYPGLVIDKKEVWFNPANQAAFDKRMEGLGLEASGVPTNVIADEVVVGFDKDQILALMEKHYGKPAVAVKAEKSWFEKILVSMFGKDKPDTKAEKPKKVVTGKAGNVQIGQIVPNFKVPVLLADDTDRDWSLSESRGKWTLLFFYPKDFTFVCPTEIREMVAAKAEFERLGVEVVLASADTLESHAKWRPDVGGEDLTYKWMADTENKVSRLLGIYDAEKEVPLRGTFLIDPEGVLQFEMTTNTLVGRNIDEIVRVVEANQTGELCPAGWEHGEQTLGEDK